MVFASPPLQLCPILPHCYGPYDRTDRQQGYTVCTDQKDVAKNVYEVDQELGGEELSLSTCPGVGNRPPSKKKIANPRGGMVTSKIEPCMLQLTFCGVLKANQEPESRADSGVSPGGLGPPFVGEFFFCKRVSDDTSSFVT